MFEQKLIVVEGARILRESELMETPQVQSTEEAPETARGKRVPATEINPGYLVNTF